MGEGFKLHFRESGPSDGPPVIFLHGLFASLQNWQTIVKRISDQYRVFNIDLLNHGSSSHTAKFTFQENVDAILEFMEEQSIDSAQFIGHSLGGKIAMLIAFQNPSKVQSLLIEDIAPKAYPPWFSFVMKAMKSLDLSAIASRKEADEILSEHILEKELRAFLLTNLLKDESGFKWRIHLDALISGGPGISSFPETEASYLNKTLFIRGEKSPYVETQDHPLIMKHFPNAEIETFEGTDHWVHAREPNLFTTRLKEFLNQA